MSNGQPTLRKHATWRPLGLSLATHGVLFTLLVAIWIWFAPQPESESVLRRGGIVLTSITEQQSTEYLTEQDILEELESKPEAQPVTAASTPPPSLPALNLDVPELPDWMGVPAAESVELDANQMAEVPRDSPPSLEYQLSADELKMIEADRALLKSRQPKGDPTSINVFGSGNLTGRSFVFVLDRSKSMGSSGLGVIHASRSELSEAISKLQPHHQFQIIGYHERTVTMSSRRLLDATKANQERVAGYIGSLAAFGGTEHENGLIAALAFQPDVVVLLTDGGYPELNDGQLHLIQRMAGEKTEIHCVQFGFGPMQKSQNFMTRLAAQNSGSFRYINVNHWKK